MKVVIRQIPMTLDERSVSRAMRIINSIRNKLNPAMKHLVSDLAEKGVEIARADLLAFDRPAYYTGQLYDSIRTEPINGGKDAKITAGEGLETDIGVSYALLVEYGTGIYGEDVNGHGIAGWNYFNERDGRWHHTVGMPARPFMHNTYERLLEEAQENGGKVIAEYLADGE